MEDSRGEQVYADAWLSVRRETVPRPDGSAGVYSVVDTADCSLVIPVDGDRVHLVEQYRHPVGARRWEFPSGSVVAGLDPDAEAVALRELREETGLHAATLTRLGCLDTMPSTLRQRCTVFMATCLSDGPPDRDPDEHDMRSAWFTRAELRRLILDGAVCDAKSLAAYTLLLLREMDA